MKPDANLHNPSPDYIRTLIRNTGLSMYKLAKLLGVGRASLYRWITGESEAPYMAQYCLESLKKRDADKAPHAYVNRS